MVSAWQVAIEIYRPVRRDLLDLQRLLFPQPWIQFQNLLLPTALPFSTKSPRRDTAYPSVSSISASFHAPPTGPRSPTHTFRLLVLAQWKQIEPITYEASTCREMTKPTYAWKCIFVISVTTVYRHQFTEVIFPSTICTSGHLRDNTPT